MAEDMYYEEEYSPIRPAHRNDIKGLLKEHWSDVYRIGKRIGRYGTDSAPLTVFSGSIAHELSLTPRDFPVLMEILEKCTDGSGNVDFTKLRNEVQSVTEMEEARHAQSLPKDWRERFGLIPRSKKSHTIRQLPEGVAAGPLRKYAIENHGPPYAITGDMEYMSGFRKSCIEQRQEHVRQVMLQVSKGSKKLPRKDFHRALCLLDAYGVSERESDDVLRTLDPKKTGFVDIDEFCSRFASEYLRPKSLRSTLGVENNDGRTNALEWPGSLLPASPRRPMTARNKEKRNGARSSAALRNLQLTPREATSTNGTSGGAEYKGKLPEVQGTNSSSNNKNARSSPRDSYNSKVRDTKASALRNEVGSVQRSWNFQNTGENWLTHGHASAQQRMREEHSQMKLGGSIPHPPNKREYTTPRVRATAAQLGNKNY